MSKALIIYGTTTGNTEMCAQKVQEGLEEAGVEVEIKNVTDASLDDIQNNQNIVFGCSTWDLGALQYDFQDFYDQWDDVDFADKKVAVFGPGDHAYEDTYCEAVKIIEEKVQEKGGEIVSEGLKIESDFSDENMEVIKNWAMEVGKKFLV